MASRCAQSLIRHQAFSLGRSPAACCGVLHYLLRFDRGAQLLIVGTYRTGELEEHDPTIALLHQLRHGEQVTEIDRRL